MESISLKELFERLIDTGKNWRPYISEPRTPGKPAQKHKTTKQNLKFLEFLNTTKTIDVWLESEIFLTQKKNIYLTHQELKKLENVFNTLFKIQSKKITFQNNLRIIKKTNSNEKNTKKSY